MWKCPSGILHWDSNSQPSDYEPPPLTTRPGLPPHCSYVVWKETKNIQNESVLAIFYKKTVFYTRLESLHHDPKDTGLNLFD